MNTFFPPSHQDSALRLDHVNPGPLQHLPAAVPRDVHLRHLRHVLLHERQAPGDTGRGLQLRDVPQVHDPAVPGEDEARLKINTFD